MPQVRGNLSGFDFKLVSRPQYFGLETSLKSNPLVATCRVSVIVLLTIVFSCVTDCNCNLYNGKVPM